MKNINDTMKKELLSSMTSRCIELLQIFGARMSFNKMLLDAADKQNLKIVNHVLERAF